MIRLGMTNPSLPGRIGGKTPKKRPGDGNRKIQQILKRIRRRKPSKPIKRRPVKRASKRQ